MLNRYTFDFDKHIWGNIRRTIRSKGQDSIWYRFLNAIFRFFDEILYEIINFFYDQIFLDHANFETLKLKGKEYDIYPKQGETVEGFRLRLKTYRNLLHMLLSVSLSKSIFQIYLEVEAEIIQGRDLDVFTIGVTPLGTGVCVNSMNWKFTWKAILPDLSAQSINREEIMEVLEDFNIASNEIIVVEDRSGGEWVWPAG